MPRWGLALALVASVACSSDPQDPTPVDPDAAADGNPVADGGALDASPDGSPPDTLPAVCGAADPAARVHEIFATSCSFSSCHDSVLPQAGMDLLAPDPESRLIGTERNCGGGGGVLVVPGDPDASFIFEKITAPTCGNRMPIGGIVSPEEQECFRDWIAGLSALAPAR